MREREFETWKGLRRIVSQVRSPRNESKFYLDRDPKDAKRADWPSPLDHHSRECRRALENMKLARKCIPNQRSSLMLKLVKTTSRTRSTDFVGWLA